MNKINPSLKHHTFIGLFVGLWIFIYTYYIKPFNGGTYNDTLWWTFLSIGFSIIAFMSYFVISIWQNNLYQRILKWHIAFEILFIALFHFLNLFFTYLFYKSPFLNGIWSFQEFFNGVIKSAILFTPVLVFARIYIQNFLPKEKVFSETVIKENDNLTIKGDYKLDILKIKKPNLVCISKSQNYVEIFFLENGNLKSKLMRSSLKKIHTELPFLVQAHRSHLINPSHFKSWKNANTIQLNQIEIPVSKNYKNAILNLLSLHLKRIF